MLAENIYCDKEKVYSLGIEITQFLADHDCTFNETEAILDFLCDKIEEQRKDYEYEPSDCNGLFHDAHDVKHKTRSADDVCIEPMDFTVFIQKREIRKPRPLTNWD